MSELESVQESESVEQTSQPKKMKKKDIKRMAAETVTQIELKLDEIENAKDQYMTGYAEQRKSVIQDGEKYLMSLLPPEKHVKIASMIWKQLKGKDYVSKTWVYECSLPGTYDEERSKSISEGISMGKPTSQQVNNSTPNARSSNLDSIVAEVINEAVLEGDHYMVPRETFDKLRMAAGIPAS